MIRCRLTRLNHLTAAISVEGSLPSESEELAMLDPLSTAANIAVTRVDRAHAAGAKVGLCGQAPSDHPEFAEFFVDCGIDSISVSSDSFPAVKQRAAARETAGGEMRKAAGGRR